MLNIKKTYFMFRNKKLLICIIWSTNVKFKIFSKWIGCWKSDLVIKHTKLFGKNVIFNLVLVYYREEFDCYHAIKKLNIQELAYLYAYSTICLESIFEKNVFRIHKEKPLPLFLS